MLPERWPRETGAPPRLASTCRPAPAVRDRWKVVSTSISSIEALGPRGTDALNTSAATGDSDVQFIDFFAGSSLGSRNDLKFFTWNLLKTRIFIDNWAGFIDNGHCPITRTVHLHKSCLDHDDTLFLPPPMGPATPEVIKALVDFRENPIGTDKMKNEDKERYWISGLVLTVQNIEVTTLVQLHANIL